MRYSLDYYTRYLFNPHPTITSHQKSSVPGTPHLFVIDLSICSRASRRMTTMMDRCKPRVVLAPRWVRMILARHGMNIINSLQQRGCIGPSILPMYANLTPATSTPAKLDTSSAIIAAPSALFVKWLMGSIEKEKGDCRPVKR